MGSTRFPVVVFLLSMAGLSMDAPAQDASDTSDSIYGRNFGSDRSASADAGGPGTIMDMIIRHQEEREREAAELEELRRRNQELVEQMRREALAIDLIIAEAHARYADSACRLATETRILIDRQTAALRSHLAEIDAQVCGGFHRRTGCRPVPGTAGRRRSRDRPSDGARCPAPGGLRDGSPGPRCSDRGGRVRW